MREGSPEWLRSFKKNGGQSIGKTRGGWNSKLHVASADDRTVVAALLSGGERHGSPKGAELLRTMGKTGKAVPLIMRAYEGDGMRALAKELGYLPVVPPKSNRKEPWEYDKELYKRRNVVERLFRRIKWFRKVFTRYDKLDVMYMGFVLFCFCIIWII